MIKKINSLLLISIIFLIYFIIQVIFILLLRFNDYQLFYEIFVIFIFNIITILTIKAVFFNPIVEVSKVLSHYNKNEFGYYCRFDTSKETHCLMHETNKMARNYKLMSDKLKERTEENEAYYNQFASEIETKKALVASISHEIKTPLAVIEASANSILDGIYTGDEVTEALKDIIRESNKTNEMLQEIVQLYKFENRIIPVDYSDYNLRIIVLDILNDLNNLVNKYNQKIEILSNLDMKIHVNYSLMKRALSNIIHNAIVYSPKNNRITIELVEKTDYKVLEIINYGITLTKEDLLRIFEPFYRADKSRQKSDDHGNGLGLYMVSQILTRHHLDFGIINVLNGVKFYLIFKDEKSEKGV